MNDLTTPQRYAVALLAVVYTASMVLLFATSWRFTLVVIAVALWSLWTLTREDATSIGADVDELEEWLK